MRLKIVSSGAFCSTFWPSSVATENLPATALTQPGGTAPSAYASNVSVHGSGRTTRARASPVKRADGRLDRARPARPDRAATVNVPSATVPFSPCERPRGRRLLAQEASLRVEQPARAASRSVPASAPARSAITCTQRRRAFALLGRLVDREPGRRLRRLRADRVDARRSRRRRRGRARSPRRRESAPACPADCRALSSLLDRQLDLAQDLRAIGVRPDDEELAALGADVELAVGQHERRLLHRAERLRPELAAGLEVERLQPRAVLDLIDARAVDDRRREAELVALAPPTSSS